jgi:hypothetical protein
LKTLDFEKKTIALRFKNVKFQTNFAKPCIEASRIVICNILHHNVANIFVKIISVPTERTGMILNKIVHLNPGVVHVMIVPINIRQIYNLNF